MWATLGGGKKKKNMKVRPGISRLPPCLLEYFVPLLCLVKGDVIKKRWKKEKVFLDIDPKTLTPSSALSSHKIRLGEKEKKEKKKKFQTKKRDFLIKNISCCVNQTENKGGPNRGIDDLI